LQWRRTQKESYQDRSSWSSLACKLWQDNKR
jgi:hypothetical protein